MFHEMRQMHLADPEFVEQHEFIVIFRTHPIAAEVSPSPVQSDLSPRQLQGLALIRAKGSLTTKEYMEATGALARAAYRDLAGYGPEGGHLQSRQPAHFPVLPSLNTFGHLRPLIRPPSATNSAIGRHALAEYGRIRVYGGYAGSGADRRLE
jgi:hypothetical protein